MVIEILDLPMKHDHFPVRYAYVKLPEDTDPSVVLVAIAAACSCHTAETIPVFFFFFVLGHATVVHNPSNCGCIRMYPLYTPS